MAAPVQAGQSLEIGFKSYSWSGYVPEDGLTVTNSYGQTEIHADLNGATRNKIRMDERTTVQGVFVIDLAETPNDVEFTDGDTITVTPPAGTETVWEINDASTAYAPGAIKLTCTLIKEVSMTYSA